MIFRDVKHVVLTLNEAKRSERVKGRKMVEGISCTEPKRTYTQTFHNTCFVACNHNCDRFFKIQTKAAVFRKNSSTTMIVMKSREDHGAKDSQW